MCEEAPRIMHMDDFLSYEKAIFTHFAGEDDDTYGQTRSPSLQLIEF